MIPLQAMDSSSLGDMIIPDWEPRGIDDLKYDISSEHLEYEDKKARLRNFIASMIESAPSWDGERAKVSPSAAMTGIKFIAALPPSKSLPRVAPDGDGDLLLVWESPRGNCIVAVQDRVLHLVGRLGTAQVEHVEAQRFLGYQIPGVILEFIPLR